MWLVSCVNYDGFLKSHSELKISCAVESRGDVISSRTHLKLSSENNAACRSRVFTDAKIGLSATQALMPLSIRSLSSHQSQPGASNIINLLEPRNRATRLVIRRSWVQIQLGAGLFSSSSIFSYFPSPVECP